MPRLDSTRYTLFFAVAVSAVCALLVSATAVGLRDRQQANALLYQQKNVLLAAGLTEAGVSLSRKQVLDIFDGHIEVRGVNLASGSFLPADGFDAKGYDQRRARNDLKQSRDAPPNAAQVTRLPNIGKVYVVKHVDGHIEQYVLPIEGLGMWGTMYGFLAIDHDTTTVRGLTFYEQKETPGLGGEIANPKWQSLWIGRKAYDADWQPQLKVIKGPAGPPSQDPHQVDGLSGATITSSGVSQVIRFWLGDAGYAPTLKKLREGDPS